MEANHQDREDSSKWIASVLTTLLIIAVSGADYLLAVAGINFIPWGYPVTPTTSESVRGSLVNAAVGCFAGWAGIAAYLLNRDLSKRHEYQRVTGEYVLSERKRLDEYYLELSKDYTSSDEYCRIHAAISLGELAVSINPELIDTKNSLKSESIEYAFPFFSRAVRRLSFALHHWTSPYEIAQVTETLKAICRWSASQECNGRLMILMINLLAEHNRSMHIDTLSSYSRLADRDAEVVDAIVAQLIDGSHSSEDHPYSFYLKGKRSLVKSDSFTTKFALYKIDPLNKDSDWADYFARNFHALTRSSEMITFFISYTSTSSTIDSIPDLMSTDPLKAIPIDDWKAKFRKCRSDEIINLSDSFLVNARIVGSHLICANFRNASLQCSFIGNTTLTGSDFLHANLSRAYISHCDMRYTLFSVNFSRGIVENSFLNNSFMDDLNGQDGSFANCGLENASCSHVDASGAHISGLNVTNCNAYGFKHGETAEGVTELVNTNWQSMDFNYRTLVLDESKSFPHIEDMEFETSDLKDEQLIDWLATHATTDISSAN